jgi:phosphoribosyl 1,2-cyclic phosphate phosphodiesterase
MEMGGDEGGSAAGKRLLFTILGCGSSTGVPRIGGEWGACDPADPRNRRRRCSLLVQRTSAAGTTTVLVDTGPDLREQLIGVGTRSIDAVLYTHDHADHTHGIDDLRFAALAARRRIDIHADERTAALLRKRFDYCFETPPGSFYPPIVRHHLIAPGEPVTVEGKGGPITAMPFLQHHGDIDSFGFRFAGLAYSADLCGLPDASLVHLGGLSVWVVDALRLRPHPTHFCLADALGWIERLAPRRAILTNMHLDLDYATLARRLPPGVEPAHDGLSLSLPAE